MRSSAMIGQQGSPGLGLGGIEPWGLVEVVGEGLLGDLFYLVNLVSFPTAGSHGELGLGWAPGGVEERGGGGLADMGQDLSDGLGIGEERDNGERFLAGWTDQREGFISGYPANCGAGPLPPHEVTRFPGRKQIAPKPRISS